MNGLIKFIGIIAVSSIILISTLVLIDAYLDIKSMHYSIGADLNHLSENISKKDTISKENIELIFDLNIVKLEGKINTLLQANTISFLFQIFSFGLIALGGYLLIFYEKKFNTIKKNSEKIIMNTLSNQIIAYLLYSASLVYHINPKNSKTRSRYLPKLRTYIKEIDRVLTLKSEYVDDGLVEICLNLNEDILTQLKLFKTQGIHEDELIETVKNIELTLKAIKA